MIVLSSRTCFSLKLFLDFRSWRNRRAFAGFASASAAASARADLVETVDVLRLRMDLRPWLSRVNGDLDGIENDNFLRILGVAASCGSATLEQRDERREMQQGPKR